MSSTRQGFAAALLGAAFCCPAPAAAKVQFTGYGDFRLSAFAGTKLFGDAPALAAFNAAPTDTRTRGFSIDSLGIFATTSLKENTDFQMDLTFRQIGNTTGVTTIQYGYLEHRPAPDVTYRAGKITLPIGYFNQNQFYSFQRVELTAPVFVRAILGLPIADVGAGAQKRWQT